MDKKKVIFIIIFVLATIGIGFALYRVFFYSPPKTTAPDAKQKTFEQSAFPQAGILEQDLETIVEPEELPTTKEIAAKPIEQTRLETIEPERIKTIIDTFVGGVDSSAGGQARFYNEQDGKFYIANSQGQTQELSSQVFYNVDNVTWSPNSNESIIEYPDGANIYYNFDTQKQVTLPKHWEAFSFSSTGDKIAAKSLGYSEENKWLISSDPNGNNINLIEPLGNNADKVIVSWSPNKKFIGFSMTGESLGADRQDVLLIGTQGENFKSLTVEGRDMRPAWSKTGSKLVYSVFNAENNFKPQLWSVDVDGDVVGENRKLLDIDTWADKCAFSDDRFIYCGVPQTMEDGAGFAPAMSDYIPDDLYKIDTKTGLKTKIEMPEPGVIQTISVSENGKTLYFTDKNKPGLYSVEL
jgi:Tol biopolymer transport system component